ncbi:MAG: hypothetical protein AAB336_05965 [Acidobacteriota bacterium]
MKWSFNFLEEQQVLVVTVIGQFSLEEQKKMFEDISSAEQWCDGIPILFDNRKLRMNDVDGEVIRKSVFVLKNFCDIYPKSKIAGLVNADINFGLGRQFESYSEIDGEMQFRLFKDEILAIEWLKK